MACTLTLGANYLGGGRCRFRVWAPKANRVDIRILSPKERLIPMESREKGYHEVTAESVEIGSFYVYSLNGAERPDPASRFQPQGVHGPSQVIDPDFPWEDEFWFGIPLQDHVIYELHVGTFTPDGTFEALIPHLEELKGLGITAIELMPVAQFPGARNWGYDGAYPFAAQNSYGGPAGLKRLVNACHKLRLAVILDVVYNHLGPEGNYLPAFAPYFTQRYRSPWGDALNFDGAYSDEVRRFFIENALYWITEVHLDGLRLDAVHAILDHSPIPFVEELASEVKAHEKTLNRQIHLFAESSANDARLIRPRELGGYGIDAQWNDDFHHCLHALLTGEQQGYYRDFRQVNQLAKSFREGFAYSGEYAPYRRRRHGSSSRDIAAERFVVFAQNHDHVGNRSQSERLSGLVSFESIKLAAGLVLLGPFIPLLFMGEEYGETAPFTYFTSHTDPELAEAVRRGRREEFAGFDWQGEPPDPQSESTFASAKLNRELHHEGRHRVLLDFYRELIHLRKTTPALARLSKEHMEVSAFEWEKALYLRRWADASETFMAVNLSDAKSTQGFPLPEGIWLKRLDSAEERWDGAGSSIPGELRSGGRMELQLEPHAFVLFIKGKAEQQD